MHGGFHGGWCWSRVAALLRARGHTVHAPTQTGCGERSHLMSKSITLDTFVDDIANVLIWEDLNDVVLVGHSFGGIADFYDLLFNVLPDIHIKMTHEYDVPGYSIREGVVTGTHSADFAGVPASGRTVVFPFCGIYIFGDDPTRLIAERAYWDNDGLARQMRGESTVGADMPWHKTK